MDLQVTIDKSQRLMTARLSGDVCDADFATIQDRFESNPDFDRTYARICDMSNVTAMKLSPELVKAWAADPILDPGARHAVVCNKPAVMKCVLDFVSASRKQLRDVLVFPNYSDAARWIRDQLESGERGPEIRQAG